MFVHYETEVMSYWEVYTPEVVSPSQCVIWGCLLLVVLPKAHVCVPGFAAGKLLFFPLQTLTIWGAMQISISAFQLGME